MTDPNPLKDILYQTAARYITVSPSGFLIDERLVPFIDARIHGYGAARTLYRGRKPHCRSLNAVHSIQGKLCNDCLDRKHCTSQVRIDLLVAHHPYRLLLAYSSAKNFLLYVAALPARGIPLDRILTRITVLDRGSWGELKFHHVTSTT